MELYRLNVLERIGREEGSQIVIYGLGSGEPGMARQIAAAAAGAQTGNRGRPSGTPGGTPGETPPEK